MPSPTGVPPGSRATSGSSPIARRRAASRAICVDLPEPSPPSNVTKSPGMAPLLRARLRAGRLAGSRLARRGLLRGDRGAVRRRLPDRLRDRLLLADQGRGADAQLRL